MLVFFLWVAWLIILFRIVGDVFRRHDTSGWAKAAWLVFVIVLPFLGVFVYLIANGSGMARRDVEQAQAQRAELDDYIRSVARSEGQARPGGQA
jgi:hypothetical protein